MPAIAVRRAVQADRMFELANLRGAGRQDQVLRGDGVDHIGRRQAFGQQRLRVEVDRHHARLAAVREWHGRPWQGN